MRLLKEIKKVCLAKIGWNFVKNDNTLWCKVLKGKYDRDNTNVGCHKAKPHDSSLWKALVQSSNAIDTKLFRL